MTLLVIDAPRFYAGVELDDQKDRVVKAAPILRHDLMWKTRAEVLRFCRRKGYRVIAADNPHQIPLFDE